MHYEALLVRAAGTMEFQQSLATVRRGLTEVTHSLERSASDSSFLRRSVTLLTDFDKKSVYHIRR